MTDGPAGTLAQEHALVRAHWDRRSEGWADRPARARHSHAFRDRLGTAMGTPVLDAGCANGELLESLLDRGVHDVYGVDISPVAVTVARSRLRGRLDVDRRIAVADLAELSTVFPGIRFATIVCDGVLHYSTWSGARRMMGQLGARLASGGLAFVVVRADTNRVSNGTLVPGERQTYRRPGKDGIVCCHFSERDVRDLVGDGLEILECRRSAYRTRTKGKRNEGWCVLLRRSSAVASLPAPGPTGRTVR